MKLSKLIKSEFIKIPLKADTKEEALKEMVRFLTDTHNLEHFDEILEKVLEREKKMSTGIGYGIAVPHAKYDGIKDICLAVGVAKEGVPFEAIDDEPVHLIYVMISPAETAEPHILTLSAISRMMSYDDMRHLLKEAKDADEFLSLLKDGEEKYLSKSGS